MQLRECRKPGKLRNVRNVGILVALVAMAASGSACAGQIVRPSLNPHQPWGDALLIVPGFGYSRAAEDALRRTAASISEEGFDVYAPKYVSRAGLDRSGERLHQFIRAHELQRYQRLHVFAFIAGAWTLNPLLETGELPNLATVVYDRSPLQERAARIATDSLHFLTWVRFGTPVFDLARTPYPPLATRNVSVAIMVETKPTAFVKKRAATATRYGPYQFECESLAQRFDDCAYLSMSHNEVYTRFDEVWPELRSFIRTGRFTDEAGRTPPSPLLLGMAGTQ